MVRVQVGMDVNMDIITEEVLPDHAQSVELAYFGESRLGHGLALGTRPVGWRKHPAVLRIFIERAHCDVEQGLDKDQRSGLLYDEGRMFERINRRGANASVDEAR